VGVVITWGRRSRQPVGGGLQAPAQKKDPCRAAEEERRLHERHREQDRRRIAAEQSLHGPSLLGGQKLSTEELGDIRRRQEREQQLAAKYPGIRRKVHKHAVKGHLNRLVIVSSK